MALALAHATHTPKLDAKPCRITLGKPSLYAAREAVTGPFLKRAAVTRNPTSCTYRENCPVAFQHQPFFHLKGRIAKGADIKRQTNSRPKPDGVLTSSPNLLGAPRPSVAWGDGRSPDSRVEAYLNLPGRMADAGPVVFVRFALRLQLRGQSRVWRLLATPDRVPFSSRVRLLAHENHHEC